MSMTGAEKLADLGEANDRPTGSRTKHVATILRVKEDGDMELIDGNDTKFVAVKPGGIGIDSGGTLRDIGAI